MIEDTEGAEDATEGTTGVELPGNQPGIPSKPDVPDGPAIDPVVVALTARVKTLEDNYAVIVQILDSNYRAHGQTYRRDYLEWMAAEIVRTSAGK